MKWAKPFFKKPQARPVAWQEIPSCLRRRISAWLVLAGGVLLANVLVYGYFSNGNMAATGFVLSGAIILIAVYYYMIARLGAYQKITGIVRKAGKSGLFLQNTSVVIDTEEGDCIRFIVRERPALFAPGLLITIYLPKSAKESKTIGDAAYHEYFAVEFGKE